LETLKHIIPPPYLAELPVIVTFCRIGLELPQCIPPPPSEAEELFITDKFLRLGFDKFMHVIPPP
jgi:hypothetical protein